MNIKYFRFCLFLAVGLATPVGVLSQAIPSTPNRDLRIQMENAARAEYDIQSRMAAMRLLEKKMIALSERDSRGLLVTPQLDKKARDRVFSMRRIETSDIERYLSFLSGERTGIFKIFADFDCVSKNVVRIDGPCRDFVPESSSFSFRTRNYTDAFYHDVSYRNDEIFGDGFFSQGIFVSLGDVPVESIDLSNSAVKRLDSFKPAADPSAARDAAVQFKAGIEVDGYTYAQQLKPVENTTYLMRTIAYRIQNSLPPAKENSPITELRFHSLAFDKRVDQIIAFRVIRKAENGALTIVWKELSRRDAPKIKFPKGAPLADFKP